MVSRFLISWLNRHYSGAGEPRCWCVDGVAVRGCVTFNFMTFDSWLLWFLTVSTISTPKFLCRLRLYHEASTIPKFFILKLLHDVSKDLTAITVISFVYHNSVNFSVFPLINIRNFINIFLHFSRYLCLLNVFILFILRTITKARAIPCWKNAYPSEHAS